MTSIIAASRVYASAEMIPWEKWNEPTPQPLFQIEMIVSSLALSVVTWKITGSSHSP